MYEELIQRLENAAGGPEGIRMAYKAADAITALQTKNAEKDKEIERLKIELRYKQSECDSHYEDFCEAKAALSSVEAERDAAVQCMHNVKQALTDGELVLDSLRGAQGEA